MRKIVDIANVAVTVLVGAYLIVMALGWEAMIALPQWLRSSWTLTILTIAVGLLLVGANVLVLYNEIQIGGFGQYLRITTDQGRTNFFIPTLEMQLQRELRAEPDIVEPLVMLTPRGEGKPMKCEVELKLRRTRGGLQRIDEIKRKVRDIFDRLITGGITVEVLVDVRDFIPEAGAQEILPDAAEFNGPVYTDGAGSEGV